ncbi:MAG: septation protein A [Gammaproteobacteria bacterium]|jgi:intracellular septation protein
MTALIDFLPLIVFFVAFKLWGIFAATAAIIAASLATVLLHWMRTREWRRMPLIAAGLAVILGGATLLLHDPAWIKWKFTLVEWLFGAVFIGSAYVGRKPLIQHLLDEVVSLPVPRWRHLSMAWGLFFVFLGTLNVWVMYHFSTDSWVNFKVFVANGLLLGFVLIQGVYLVRHGQFKGDD